MNVFQLLGDYLESFLLEANLVLIFVLLNIQKHVIAEIKLKYFLVYKADLPCRLFRIVKGYLRKEVSLKATANPRLHVRPRITNNLRVKKASCLLLLWLVTS